MVNKFTVAGLRKLPPNKKLADGGGLYVFTDNKASGHWRYLFTFKGRRCRMSLGSLRDVTLAEARELATDARRLVRSGVNPIEARRIEKRACPTFGKVSDELLASKTSEWRNEKHREQWERSLNVMASPLRDIPVHEIDTSHILAVLKPMWVEKQETASRFRQRLEAVLNAAKAKGYRSGENPAAWRGHLAHLLPSKPRLAQQHHAAMDYKVVPKFMVQLYSEKTMAAYALQFAILTAARSGEVYGATWDEIDFDTAVWNLSAERMKSGRSHRVPISSHCLDLLHTVRKERRGDYVFSGQKKYQHLSHVSMAKVIKRLGVENATPHGFRSSFRDYCGNETNFPREVAEAALAHVIGDAAEQAYRRSDALDKRRALMEIWGKYCFSAFV